MATNQLTSIEVQVLTAEVRVLKVGNRQITLSVYRQLDTVDDDGIEPFGRVRDNKDDAGTWVVGRHKADNTLVRSRRCRAYWHYWQTVPPGCTSPWFLLGPYQHCYLGYGKSTAALPTHPGSATIAEGRLENYRLRLEPPKGTQLQADSDVLAGEWAYASKEDKARIESHAHAAIAKYEKACEPALLWESLPLIILAGLK